MDLKPRIVTLFFLHLNGNLGRIFPENCFVLNAYNENTTAASGLSII